MPTQTFSVEPASGAALSIKPSVAITEFGDGYEQRTPQGINNQPRAWSLEFIKPTLAEAQSILSFFEARAARESFFWTPPIGVQGIFVCREWSVSISAPSFATISATFEEVFE